MGRSHDGGFAGDIVSNQRTSANIGTQSRIVVEEQSRAALREVLPTKRFDIVNEQGATGGTVAR